MIRTHDILRLEIAMHKAYHVQGLKSVYHLETNIYYLVQTHFTTVVRKDRFHVDFKAGHH